MTSHDEGYDVAIVGGGPVGSTAATLLKKYAPDMRVIVLEKEIFLRDHIGESMLQPICHVLNEMGVWDAVEAAGFPIKIGAFDRSGGLSGHVRRLLSGIGSDGTGRMDRAKSE